MAEVALLDVGKFPVHLAMKPDGGEIFVSNFGSDSISEIATTCEPLGNSLARDLIRRSIRAVRSMRARTPSAIQSDSGISPARASMTRAE